MKPARPAPSTRAARSGQTHRIRGERVGQGHSDLATVRAFVDRHYAKPLTIDQLAGRARLSPFHFIRAFHAAYGETPHRYLRGKRVERAKELLVTTPIPITEICDQVGFQSLGSFSSLFRRLTGETPAEYRAARRKNVYIPSCFIRMYRADRG